MSSKIEEGPDCYSFISTSELILKTDVIKIEMNEGPNIEENVESQEVESESENVQQECVLISEHGPSFQLSVVKSEDVKPTSALNVSDQYGRLQELEESTNQQVDMRTKMSLLNTPVVVLTRLTHSLIQYNENKGALYWCGICGKAFGLKSNLKRHLNIHTGQYGRLQELEESTDQQIDFRTKMTSSKAPVVVLKRLKHSLIKYSKNEGALYWCGICGKNFDLKVTLKRHLKTHSDNKSFECNVCSKGFTTSSHLRHHELIHTREKPFTCEICKKCFKSVRNLKSHLNIHSNKRSHICNVCNKAFRYANILYCHKFIHTRDKTFTCEFCKKMFGRKDNLKAHLKMHNDVKPYICDICDKGFTEANIARRHKLTHTERERDNNKPFTCEICKKSFRHKSSLERHLNIHSAVKPFVCNECNRSFSDASTMRRHKLVHNEEKPFVCDLCKKSFRLKANLKTHLKIHRIKKP